MSKLSRKFYLSSISVGLGLPNALVVVMVAGEGWSFFSEIEFDELATIFLLVLPAVYATVVMLLLWHKMWAAIQDGHARTTPSKAVGLLFVPVWNLYWLFQVTLGWAKDYNDYLQRHSLGVPNLPTGTFRAYSILSLVVGVMFVTVGPVAPPLWMLALVATFIVGLVMVSRICRAVNELPNAGGAGL